MTASLLIKKAAAEGVRIRLESDNKLKACGPSEARAKWLPILREHKSELLAELSASDRKTARPPLRKGGESWRTYHPAHLQEQADHRNSEAMHAGSTDRFCGCGALATLAWPDDDGRDVWRCLKCGPVRGRA
jgi:hypothetical protein